LYHPRKFTGQKSAWRDRFGGISRGNSSGYFSVQPVFYAREFENRKPIPYDKQMNSYNYVRGPGAFFGGPVTRTVRLLIIINIAVFLLQFAGRLAGTNAVDVYFGLIPALVTQHLMVWQLFTYMFLHGGVWHILFNMLALFMFGNDLERVWGTRRFVTYYFITGIGAGICSWLVAINSRTVTIGASGAIYGLLLAYGVLWPNRIVYLNFLLPIKVKWLVIIYGAIAFLSSLSAADSGVAHIAHLGGMLVGLVYLKWKDWFVRYQTRHEQRRREELKRQFEAYYAEMRHKLENENKKGPTIH
jgi:membrane associated rhomboid family serine protease